MVKVKRFKKMYISKPKKWPVILSLVNRKDQKYFRITKESKYLYTDMLPYIYPEGKEFRSFIDNLYEIDKNVSSPKQFLRDATIEKDKFNTVMKQIYGETVLSVRIEPDHKVSQRKKGKNYIVIRKIYWKKFKEALESNSKEDVTSIFQKYDYLMKCNFGFLYEKLILRDEAKPGYIEEIQKTTKTFTNSYIHKIRSELSKLYKLYKKLLIISSTKNEFSMAFIFSTGLKFQLESLKHDLKNYDFVASYSKLRSTLITICKIFLVLSKRSNDWGDAWPYKKNDGDILKKVTNNIPEFQKLINEFIKARDIKPRGAENCKTSYDPNKDDNYLHLRFYSEYSEGFVHQYAYVIPALSVYETMIFKNEISKFVEAMYIMKEYYKV